MNNECSPYEESTPHDKYSEGLLFMKYVPETEIHRQIQILT
jgi:hypothetical protein